MAAGAEFVEGDLADRTLLTETLMLGRFDGVMHFAALIEAGESMSRPEIYFRNNTAGTLTLLEAMLATGHNRLVFSSTAACYGEPVSDADSGRCEAGADQRLWREQAAGGADAGLVQPDAWVSLCEPALLQRGGGD